MARGARNRKRAKPQESKRILLHDQVVRPAQAETLIRAVSGSIVALDHEANTDHRGVGTGGLVHVIEQGPKHPLAASSGNYVNALNPPEPTVAPVAPLVRDPELADYLVLALGEEVT